MSKPKSMSVRESDGGGRRAVAPCRTVRRPATDPRPVSVCRRQSASCSVPYDAVRPCVASCSVRRCTAVCRQLLSTAVCRQLLSTTVCRQLLSTTVWRQLLSTASYGRVALYGRVSPVWRQLLSTALYGRVSPAAQYGAVRPCVASCLGRRCTAVCRQLLSTTVWRQLLSTASYGRVALYGRVSPVWRQLLSTALYGRVSPAAQYGAVRPCVASCSVRRCTAVCRQLLSTTVCRQLLGTALYGRVSPAAQYSAVLSSWRAAQYSAAVLPSVLPYCCVSPAAQYGAVRPCVVCCVRVRRPRLRVRSHKHIALYLARWWTDPAASDAPGGCGGGRLGVQPRVMAVSQVIPGAVCWEDGGQIIHVLRYRQMSVTAAVT
ncbi:uncharacterized protein LOC122382971 [Amphibalanus amphitrite]|uniref:uncharacterized protein LOC122382971 n=1 Tax=Amphibalanus amphitrite TaxID=1232801 RepID=UPI001C905745|nr:uncharacterized protein LOC122382971 [Amphibalanus amphitrite]